MILTIALNRAVNFYLQLSMVVTTTTHLNRKRKMTILAAHSRSITVKIPLKVDELV